ncbi:hypothetical protein ABVT39_011639 [Epinephelus coioides]
MNPIILSFRDYAPMHLVRVAGIFTNGASAGAQTKWCQKTWSRASFSPFTVEGLDPTTGLTNNCKRLLCTYDLTFGGFVSNNHFKTLTEVISLYEYCYYKYIIDDEVEDVQ